MVQLKSVTTTLGLLFNCAALHSSYHFGEPSLIPSNRTKCKYMIVSRKTNLSTPSSPLLLEGHPLDQVEMFQYLGVLLSHDLTCGEHVQSTCKKARKILGLLYRRFYNNAPGNSLLQLYLSLVRPHLDYASAVWSPYLIKDKAALECPKICMPYGNQILGQ